MAPSSVALTVVVFAQQQPSFRTAVDLVTVDVHVVDASGNPATGLRPEDFTISVDGRPRRTATAQFVDYSVPASLGGSAREAAGVPAPPIPIPAVPPPARTVYLVINVANIRPGGARFAAAAAAAFIGRLRPQDRLGLLTIPYNSTRIEATRVPRSLA